MNVPDEIVDMAKVVEAVKVITALPKTVIGLNHYGGNVFTVAVYPWGMTKIAPIKDWQFVENEPFWNDGEPKGYKYDAFVVVDGIRFRALVGKDKVPEGAFLPAAPILVEMPIAEMALTS
jgi:hypothetical protein